MYDYFFICLSFLNLISILPLLLHESFCSFLYRLAFYMECWLPENVELNSRKIILAQTCHDEVKGHINNIVFNGNIIIVQFLKEHLKGP